MARQLMLYPQADDQQAYWWLLERGRVSAEGQGGVGDLLRQWARKAQVFLLLPPPQAMLYAVDAVTGQYRQMQKAAPWALEDRLLQPVEALSIQPARQALGERWPVAVLDRHTLAEWQNRLEGSPLRQASLLPAVALLRGSPARPALWLTRGMLVWHVGSHAQVVPADQWRQLLASPDLELDKAERIALWREPGQPLPADWDETHPAWQGRPLELRDDLPFHSSLGSGQLPRWNWLHAAARKPPAWRWTAALLVLLLVSWLGRDFWQMQRWNRQAEALGARMEQIYRAAFPDAGRVVDARAQMKQRLDALRRAAGEQVEGSLLSLLQQIGPALAQPGLRLDSLRYRQPVLEMNVHAPDLSRLDRLRQAMEQATGRPVRMTVTTEAGEGATAQFRLGGEGSP